MTREILIVVEGGVVQAVCDVPEGITVRIRDYDVDGCSDGELHRDRDGERYRESIWRHEDSCAPPDA